METKACGCGCGGAAMVLACSGAADVGEISDRAARRMGKMGVAKMFCLAGLGGQVAEMVEKVKGTATVVVIDGCEKDCGKRACDAAGVAGFRHVRVTNLGLEKGKSPATEETVEKVAAIAAGQLGCR